MGINAAHAKEYEEAHAEAAAQKIVALKEGEKGNFEEIFKDIEKAANDNGLQLGKLREQALKRAAELTNKSKSERETAVIKKYEGRVKLIDANFLADGKPDNDVDLDSDSDPAKYQFMPAGIHKEFRVHYTLPRWMGWNADNSLQRNFNAKDLDKMVDQTEKLAQEVAAKKTDLELLKATGLSDWAVMRGWNALKSGYDVAQTTRRAKGNWVFSGAFIDSVKGAHELQKQNQERYDVDLRKLKKREKNLKKKQDVLNDVMKQIGELQKEAEKVFENNFGKETAVLLAHKADPGFEYEEKVGKLREAVRAFGDKIGYVYFEYFLNKKLGIKPGVIEQSLKERTRGENPEDKIAYTTPKTKVEIATEKVKIGKWWEAMFGVEGAPNVIENFIQQMRKSDPTLFAKINDNKLGPEYALILKFLFVGEHPTPGVKNTKLLDHKKAENVVKTLKDIPKYLQKVGGDIKKLEEILLNISLSNNFANFDQAFELTSEKMHSGVEKDDKVLAAAINWYKDVFGDAPSDEDKKALDSLTPDKLALLQQNLQNNKFKEVLQFYFQGKIDSTVLTPQYLRRVTDRSTQLESITEIADKIISDTEKYAWSQRVFESFVNDPAYAGQSLATLDENLFNEIYGNLRMQEVDEYEQFLNSVIISPGPFAATGHVKMKDVDPASPEGEKLRNLVDLRIIYREFLQSEPGNYAELGGFYKSLEAAFADKKTFERAIQNVDKYKKTLNAYFEAKFDGDTYAKTSMDRTRGNLIFLLSFVAGSDGNYNYFTDPKNEVHQKRVFRVFDQDDAFRSSINFDNFNYIKAQERAAELEKSIETIFGIPEQNAFMVLDKILESNNGALLEVMDAPANQEKLKFLVTGKFGAELDCDFMPELTKLKDGDLIKHITEMMEFVKKVELIDDVEFIARVNDYLDNCTRTSVKPDFGTLLNAVGH